MYCTYGYDVIAHIGWRRQTHHERFETIHQGLQPRLQISESEVRHLYHKRYLPLLACHERQYLEELKAVSEQGGLMLNMDGLAPEGGESQLWVVRELRLGLTLRSGWLSRQDRDTFVNFLQPIADLGLRVIAVMSDKRRGLEPAVPIVFPQAKHSFCQMHYLKNAAEFVAEEDQAMKVTLRKMARDDVGDLIRREKVEKPGVLTVTGLVPTPVEKAQKQVKTEPQVSQTTVDPVAQEHETIVRDLQRRVRYLLTLKGRPPLRLAGIEMYERLTEVETCLNTLLNHRTDSRLVELKRGLHSALSFVHTDYIELRQAANWLEHVSVLLDTKDQPDRSGTQVQQKLFAYLDTIPQENQLDFPPIWWTGDANHHARPGIVQNIGQHGQTGLRICHLRHPESRLGTKTRRFVDLQDGSLSFSYFLSCTPPDPVPPGPVPSLSCPTRTGSGSGRCPGRRLAQAGAVV